MTVFNLGSINIDHFYTVPHFPEPGETLAMIDHWRMLGGKGANQSMALARAGARVIHIGAANAEDDTMLREMRDAGIDMKAVQQSRAPSGHAIITVAADGENRIMLYAGANREIDMKPALAALEGAGADDWALLQNETNGAEEFVRAARKRGMKIAYSAAPFDAEVAAGILPHTNLLVLNEGEANALFKTTDRSAAQAGVEHLVITRGGDGADYYGGGEHIHQPAHKIDAVDTTGAGDCFFGYFLAGLARGDDVETVLGEASAAAALQVTRKGTAAAIPKRDEVAAFLDARGVL